MHAGEDFREGFAALEVQAAIVGDFGLPGAAIVGANQFAVGLGRRPAGTNGQLGIDLAFNVTDIEAHAPGVRRSEADCQRQFGATPEPVN